MAKVMQLVSEGATTQAQAESVLYTLTAQKKSPQTRSISTTGQLVKMQILRLSPELLNLNLYFLIRSSDNSNSYQNWRSAGLNHYSILPQTSLSLGILSNAKCLFSSLCIFLQPRPHKCLLREYALSISHILYQNATSSLGIWLLVEI